jgi:homoaconitase/3-isopropylmalate dehydratase large subunit
VDDGGKGGCGIRGAVTRLLPAEVLDVLVRLGTMLAWACCARRCLGGNARIPARGRLLVSSPAKNFEPEGSGRRGEHVSHATGQVVRATE